MKIKAHLLDPQGMKIYEIPDFFVQFFRQILSELFFGARVFHNNQVSLYFVDNISCSSDPTTNFHQFFKQSDEKTNTNTTALQTKYSSF
jgi:hypothetical protein